MCFTFKVWRDEVDPTTFNLFVINVLSDGNLSRYITGQSLLPVFKISSDGNTKSSKSTLYDDPNVMFLIFGK